MVTCLVLLPLVATSLTEIVSPASCLPLITTEKVAKLLFASRQIASNNSAVISSLTETAFLSVSYLIVPSAKVFQYAVKVIL